MSGLMVSKVVSVTQTDVYPIEIVISPSRFRPTLIGQV